MDPVLEFDTREESIISLEYEKLGNHCSYCFRLTHLQSQCPEKPKEVTTKETRIASTSPLLKYDRRGQQLTNNESLARKDERSQPQFKERLDRHGNPFGDRVSLKTKRAQGPRNKIAPYSESSHAQQGNLEYRPKRTASPHKISPPSNLRRAHESITVTTHTSKSQEWLNTVALREPGREPSSQPSPPRRPLERNLAASDFPSGQVPTVDEILDELNEVTRMYVNVDDPVERAAR